MTNEAEIKNWLSNYRRAWASLCQALMWRLCEAFGLVPVDGIGSATDAYNIERRAGRIRTDAPPATGGVFVYFSVPGEPDGHVGYLMNAGRLLMASTTLIQEWVDSDAGYSTIAQYIADHPGAKVLGWSYQNGGNTVSNWTPDTAPTPQTEHRGNTTGQPEYMAGDDWEFWVPGTALAARVQAALSGMGRYNYDDGTARPADGLWGDWTVKGIQQTCAKVGYEGKLDGDAGEGTTHYVQVYAEKWGDYTGGVDDFLGENSWAGFALGLERK